MRQTRIDTMQRVGMVIREAREGAHLTQQQLCAKAHVSRSWLIHVENGKPSIDLYKILATFQALGLTLVADDSWPDSKRWVDDRDFGDTQHTDTSTGSTKGGGNE